MYFEKYFEGEPVDMLQYVAGYYNVSVKDPFCADAGVLRTSSYGDLCEWS